MEAQAQAAAIARAEVSASAEVSALRPDGPAELARRLGPGPFALVVVFLSPRADPEAWRDGLAAALPGVRIVGCTTAGEITAQGYAEGRVQALGFPATIFAAETVLLPDLDLYDPQQMTAAIYAGRQRLAARRPDLPHEFAFLLVDGLSVREDELAAALAGALGEVPFFGGSAGDGTRFARTRLLHDSSLLDNAAALCLLRTACPLKVFNLDHLVPTERRMVVTAADPARRIVREINAEPAAREYARLLGKDPEQLGPFTFAAHPVVVRLGGRHHVRAIQRVDASGELVFFSAIDEGLVLTLAEPRDMAAHLDAELGALAAPAPPARILAFDCILRRLEAEQTQTGGRVSAVLAAHKVVGFSTYGEQLEGMHVNQTMTGIALYPPGTVLERAPR